MTDTPMPPDEAGTTLFHHVLENSKARNGPRLVLLAIAWRAADTGHTAEIGVAELRRLTGLSERAVQNAIVTLRELGELEVEEVPGRINRQTIVLAAGNRGGAVDDQSRRLRRKALRSRSRRIWDRDRWECQIRGNQCTWYMYLTIGHIVSIEQGGTDDDNNVQTECVTCNIQKGGRA